MKTHLPFCLSCGANRNGSERIRWCEKKGSAYPLGRNSPLPAFPIKTDDLFEEGIAQ